MAKIIYALSGQGRGHTSRVIAVSDELRRRGHEVVFCCGGTAQEILEAKGEPVLPVPALRQVMQSNEVQPWQTIRYNWKTVLNTRAITARLTDVFREEQADLLINDFEAFSHRAAARMGLPAISFNHQQVVTETRYELPRRYWVNAQLTGLAIRLIAPAKAAHILLSSFFFPPLRHPAHTTLVAPIIRPAVQTLAPRRGEHVLVYYNQTAGAEHVVETLRQVDASFILYNFDAPADPARYPNLTFKEPCLDGFLDDLASSRAVLCTAGFTLISEALFLNKPLLVVPNRGIFEQTINALFLEREGLGKAIIDRPLTALDVEDFLDRGVAYEARLARRDACGNEAAVACIEAVLREVAPSALAPARTSNGRATAPALAASVEKAP